MREEVSSYLETYYIYDCCIYSIHFAQILLVFWEAFYFIPCKELKKTSVFPRIGRTGRGNAKGWATTLINKSVGEAVLLDLKHLLIEAKQKVDKIFALNLITLSMFYKSRSIRADLT